MQDIQIIFATSTSQIIEKPKTLKQAVDAYFVLHLGKLSESYQQWSATRLRSLVQFLGPDLTLDKLTIWQLDVWYSDLASRDRLYEDHPYRKAVSRPPSASYLHGHVRAVKSFFSWLGKRRLITSNPAALLDFPPIPEQPPRHARREDVEALLRRFEEAGQARNFTAVRLLVATGLRAGGLSGLRKRDVDSGARLITVREKGRGGQQKGRTVPVGKATMGQLVAYMNSHNEPFVFAGDRGGPWTSSALYQSLARASRAIPLEQVVGPHMLRHYFGFESIRRGVPLRVVQQIMGHASSTTTEIYTRFKPLELREVYDRFYGNE